MTINGYTGEPTGNGLRHVITRRKQGKNVSEEFGKFVRRDWSAGVSRVEFALIQA